MKRLRWLGLVALLAWTAPAMASPVMAIIIDDLGFRQRDSIRATELPGTVACAVIPGSPHATGMARAAHRNGKEVLLHLPMQSTDPSRPVGAEGISLETSRTQLKVALENGLAEVPHARGVNNHMGSLITRHPGHMTWLMDELHARKLYFVDSVTTGASVAYDMARERGVATTTRDVFIDREDATEGDIRAQLQRAVRLARQRGDVLVIGHPYPQTMTVLEQELPRLEQQGVRLVTVSELIGLRDKTVVGQTANVSTKDGIRDNED